MFPSTSSSCKLLSCHVVIGAILIMSVDVASYTNLCPLTSEFGADLVCITSGDRQTRLFVNVTLNGLMYEIGIRNFDNFLSLDLINMDEVPCCDLVQELYEYDEEDNPYYEWLVRSPAVPDVCNDSVCAGDCGGIEDCIQCDVTSCYNHQFYADLLSRPEEDFLYSYIRAAFIPSGESLDMTTVDTIVLTTFASQTTLGATDDNNHVNQRKRRSVSHEISFTDIFDNRYVSYDPSDNEEHHTRRKRSVSDEGTGSSSHEGSGKYKAVIHEKITVPGSFGRIPYPARLVRLCSFSQPGVCACSSGSEITTCCARQRWFIQVPHYIFKTSHFMMFYRTRRDTRYIQGSPNILDPSTAGLGYLSDWLECDAFKFRPRAVVPSARTLALETWDYENYFLTLERCLDGPVGYGGVNIAYDNSSYNYLRHETRIRIINSNHFVPVSIPDRCFE